MQTKFPFKGAGLMSDLIIKVRKTLQESLDNARKNAQALRDLAESYSHVTRLKFELRQLKTSKRKKLTLLGETVFPYLAELKYDELQQHETIPVLVDEIKNLQNEIDLSEKALEKLSEKEEAVLDTEEIRTQINELEDEIESRLNELKSVKKVVDKKNKKTSN